MFKVVSIICLLCIGGLSIYTYGYSSGYKDATYEYLEQMNQYKDALKKKEFKYAEENSKLRDQVVLVQRNYESKLAMLSSSYDNQLRKSNDRVRYYRNQASSSSKCRDLATHTARLDNSLTEGIHLVKQLSEHIRLRDAQLKQVGIQIKQEREFIE